MDFISRPGGLKGVVTIKTKRLQQSFDYLNCLPKQGPLNFTSAVDIFVRGMQKPGMSKLSARGLSYLNFFVFHNAFDVAYKAS
jgi:hypothetical protein